MDILESEGHEKHELEYNSIIDMGSWWDSKVLL
jgi:hypothetical protein